MTKMKLRCQNDSALNGAWLSLHGGLICPIASWPRSQLKLCAIPKMDHGGHTTVFKSMYDTASASGASVLLSSFPCQLDHASPFLFLQSLALAHCIRRSVCPALSSAASELAVVPVSSQARPFTYYFPMCAAICGIRRRKPCPICKLNHRLHAALVGVLQVC